MSTLALQAIQPALVTKLRADGVLMGMVSGVFDAPPQQAALPYVVIGDASSSDESQLVNELSVCVFELRVWTRGGGRKIALAIMNRIHGLLHQESLVVAGFTFIAMRSTDALTNQDAANDRTEGVMRIEIMVSEP